MRRGKYGIQISEHFGHKYLSVHWHSFIYRKKPFLSKYKKIYIYKEYMLLMLVETKCNTSFEATESL